MASVMHVIGISCVISAFSCVCVCFISAMGDGNCSPGGSATVVKCKSQCGVRVTSGGE